MLLLVVSNNMTTGQQICPDLSPCNCVNSNGKFSVQCNDVTMEEVKAVFNRTIPPIDIFQLSLFIVPPSGDFVPADLLGQSRTDQLYFYGPLDSPYPLLSVDPNAFRSSINTLQYIYMLRLNASQLNFDFLVNFEQVNALEFNYITNLDGSISTLPAMPTLRSLSFFFSTGLNEAFQSNNNATLKSDDLTFLHMDLGKVI